MKLRDILPVGATLDSEVVVAPVDTKEGLVFQINRGHVIEALILAPAHPESVPAAK